MPLDQLVILALIQGITEFLPISSSGHLVLIPALMGWQGHPLFMDVAVHLGTLGSVMVYFYRDIGKMFLGFFHMLQRKSSPERKLFLNLFLATLPVVLCGYLIDRYLAHLLRGVWVIAYTSIVFGLLLYGVDRYQKSDTRKISQISWGHALVWGVFQVIALVPGVSRSGICMTAGRWLGYHRVEAAHFSFLMAIPTILAAGTLKTYQCIQAGDSHLLQQGLLGGAIAFVTGLCAISWMMRWLRQGSFLPFVIYRICLGIILLLWFF
ncbi:MAG: undecaprenyl-diphosphate phosphatase [Alphaproteobacteria bacterium]